MYSAHTRRHTYSAHTRDIHRLCRALLVKALYKNHGDIGTRATHILTLYISNRDRLGMYV